MKTQIVITAVWLLLILLFANIADSFFFAKISSIVNISSLAFLGLKCSFIACFWVFVLTQDSMLFSFVKGFFESLGEKYYFKDNYIDFRKKQIFDYSMKPFFTCEICTGANLGFWSYSLSHLDEFVFLDFLFTISFISFTTIIIANTWKKYQTP